MSGSFSLKPTKRDVSKYLEGEIISCSNLLFLVLHCILDPHSDLNLAIVLRIKSYIGAKI